jgi:hypothetical protein
LKIWLEQAKIITKEKLNFFGLDGSKEYGSIVFKTMLQLQDIYHKVTSTYMPQRNIVAEHINHTIIKMACSILTQADLPVPYWRDVIHYTMEIINLMSTSILEGDNTPIEAFTSNKPTVLKFCVFRCKAYIYVLDKKYCKLNLKTIKCIFISLVSS